MANSNRAAARSVANDSYHRSGVNIAREHKYWSENYANQTDYETGRPYSDYDFAYRTGYEGFGRYPGRTYVEAEPDLKRDYETFGSKAPMTWDDAKSAVRAAWQRVERALPGDADNDGR